jgi:hypothetical protein
MSLNGDLHHRLTLRPRSFLEIGLLTILRAGLCALVHCKGKAGKSHGDVRGEDCTTLIPRETSNWYFRRQAERKLRLIAIGGGEELLDNRSEFLIRLWRMLVRVAAEA